MIPAQCVEVVMASLESLLRVGNDLVEPSPQAHSPEGFYIARALIRRRREIPVRVLNAAHRDQLIKGFLLAHCGSHAGDPTRCGTTTGLGHYPEVTRRD